MPTNHSRLYSQPIMQRMLFVVIACLFASGLLAQQQDSVHIKKQPFPFNILTKIQNGNLKVIPIPVFTLSPERGASLGVMLHYFFKTSTTGQDSSTRLSSAFLNLQYSTRKQFVSEIGYSIYTNAEKYYVQGSFGYKDFYERYWTLSGDVSNKDFLGVSYQQLFLKGRILKNLHQRLFVGITYNINNINHIEFENKATPPVPTIAGTDKSFVVGMGPTISIDKRDNQFSPQHGWYAEASIRFYEKWMGSNYTFNQAMFDVRNYIPTARKGILALNAVATITGGTVPFLEKQRLGSDKIMRGYFAGRFRDNQFAAAQMEYRYPVGKSFVLAAFVSAGQTAESLSQMQWQLMQSSVGGGLRYLVNKGKKLYIRADAGYTRLKNIGFYFSLGDAF